VNTGGGRVEKIILGSVLSQMVLGVVLSQVGILPFAQVLHVGLSAILVSSLLLWLLAARRADFSELEC